jgi:Fe2+ transport system protein FeoA
MQDLLVLGIIPGTDIVITFMMCLFVVLILLCVALVTIVLRSGMLREVLITLAVMHRLKRLQSIG